MEPKAQVPANSSTGRSQHSGASRPQQRWNRKHRLTPYEEVRRLGNGQQALKGRPQSVREAALNHAGQGCRRVSRESLRLLNTQPGIDHQPELKSVATITGCQMTLFMISNCPRPDSDVHRSILPRKGLTK